MHRIPTTSGSTLLQYEQSARIQRDLSSYNKEILIYALLKQERKSVHNERYEHQHERADKLQNVEQEEVDYHSEVVVVLENGESHNK